MYMKRVGAMVVRRYTNNVTGPECFFQYVEQIQELIKQTVYDHGE